MKKAVVILGAGASRDVNNGLSPKDKQLLPPLARELFTGRFWRFMAPYRGAEVLGAELAPIAQSSQEFDLEAKLTEFAEDKDERIREAFKHIPAYLRDVLLSVSLGYTASPSTYITLCSRLLRDQTHEILFLVLNYDDLLERALERFDPNLAIATFDDYARAGRQAIVAKVHGSIDWGVPMGSTGDWFRALAAFDVTSSEGLVLSKQGNLTTSWYTPEGQLLYPRLTAPLRGKQFCCPDPISNAALAFMSDCHKYLVIGTSGLDEDVLDAMKQSGAGLGTQLHIVNPTAAVVAQRFEQRVPNVTNIRTLHESGLIDFLGDERRLRGFLALD